MSEAQRNLTKYVEGFEAKVYADPATGAAPYTAGWGHTGKDVTRAMLGQPVSQQQAENWFNQDVAAAEARVNALVKCTRLTQGQFDCLCDMVFNMGSGFMTPDSIVGDFDDLVSACNLPEMRRRIPTFRKAGGKVMAGLVKRRAINCAIWDGFTESQAKAQGDAAVKQWIAGGRK